MLEGSIRFFSCLFLLIFQGPFQVLSSLLQAILHRRCPCWRSTPVLFKLIVDCYCPRPLPWPDQAAESSKFCSSSGLPERGQKSCTSPPRPHKSKHPCKSAPLSRERAPASASPFSIRSSRRSSRAVRHRRCHRSIHHARRASDSASVRARPRPRRASDSASARARPRPPPWSGARRERPAIVASDAQHPLSIHQVHRTRGPPRESELVLLRRGLRAPNGTCSTIPS